MDQKVSSGGFRTQDTINSCYDQVCLELQARKGNFGLFVAIFDLANLNPSSGHFLHLTKPQKEQQRSSSDP